ncbi:MAG TPA: ABC transporter substrate-binding protein [Candidatus Methylomirabilis sp.]|nr:ABC transporter substrate-binding protein [Candidatus Methylomirabilis sp.]
MDCKIDLLAEEYKRGQITRRDFLRLAAELTGGAAAASILATTPRPAAAAASGPGIKLGAVFPLTGPWAENGNNSLHGVLLAVEHVNAQGGIKSMGGARLEVVQGDTQADPALAASVTRRLVGVDKVTALFGCYLSSYTLTASTEAEKAGIPMFTNSFLDTLTERGYKYFFQLPAKATAMGTAAVSYFKEAAEASGRKPKMFANVSDDNANTQKQARTISEIAAKYGFQQLFLDFYTGGITDASAIVNKVRSSKAEFMFINGPTPDVILIVRTLRNVGWKKPIVGTGGGGSLTRGYGEALKKDADGSYGIGAWNWDLPYPRMKEINGEFTQRFKEPFIPQEAGEMYAAVWIVKEALENVKAADPEKIRNYVAATTFKEPPASLMPGNAIKFDQTGWNVNSIPIMIEWKDSMPYTVWPSQVRSRPAFFE